jgi:purine-binding chemotaxis protein CheW
MSTATTPSTQGATAPSVIADAAKGAQYLTFICAGEEYGVEILRVQEIRGWDKVTRVPYAPPYVLGIMNLRGVIVPIIDLRTRFNLEKVPFNASTVVIVVHVHISTGEQTAGIVVDGVSEVYSFAASAIVPTPNLGRTVDSVCVSNVATVDGKMILLLDIDTLVGTCVESVVQQQLNP